MNPSSSSVNNNKSTCPAIQSTNCVIWSGPDLACIDVCKGDTIADITARLAEKLCTLIDDLNLDDLDLKCVFETCIGCPEPEKTLKTVLELIINKVCSLDDIITECCTGVNGTNDPGVFDINLQCLAITNGSGEVLNDGSNDEIVQAIIDRVCNHETRISQLETRVDDVEEALANIETGGSESPQVVSDCLFIGTRNIEDAYLFLDTAFCTLQTVMGTETNVAQAISQQCSGISSFLGSNPSFVVNPTNLSDSVRNLWLLSCNLLGRLESIEDTCCAPNCDDVHIGFIITFNQDQTVTFTYTAGAGTNIPAGFIDCGSTVTITDQHNNQVVADSLNISNNGVSPDIDISSLTPGDTLSFNVLTKMCGTLGFKEIPIFCEKCVVKTAVYPLNITTACEVCEICATAGTGNIHMEYIDSITLIPGIIDITVGTCAIVHNNQVIQLLTQDGVATIDNLSCLNFAVET